MEQELEVITCDTLEAVPSVDRLQLTPRRVKLRIVFGEEIQSKRESIGNLWKSKLNGFSIGVHIQNPEINVAKLITDEEINQHQDFFLACANDYNELARSLINKLITQLNIDVNSDFLLDSFNVLKRTQSTGKLDKWRYYIHGFHCGFENTKTGQEIEVSLISGHEFGALDPYFFTRFIKSTDAYKPLPVEIYEDYADGVRILNKMIELGKFERINSKVSNVQDIVVATSRRVQKDDCQVNEYQKKQSKLSLWRILKDRMLNKK